MSENAHQYLIPVMTCTDFSKNYTPTCLSNGLVGISPGPNPLKQAKTLVSGYVFSHPMFKFENAALAPYPLATAINASGASTKYTPKSLTVKSQTLNMENGELVTKMVLTPPDNSKLEIEVLQFASRSVPALLCQQINLTASKYMQIQIIMRIDSTDLPGSAYAEKAPYDEEQTDCVLGWQSDRSKLGIALVSPAQDSVVKKGIGKYTIDAKAGRTYHFRTIAAMVSDLYHPEPHLDAIRTARWGDMLGFDLLREQNRKCWAEIWKSRIKVFGDEKGQKIVDTAL